MQQFFCITMLLFETEIARFPGYPRDRAEEEEYEKGSYSVRVLLVLEQACLLAARRMTKSVNNAL